MKIKTKASIYSVLTMIGGALLIYGFLFACANYLEIMREFIAWIIIIAVGILLIAGVIASIVFLFKKIRDGYEERLENKALDKIAKEKGQE